MGLFLKEAFSPMVFCFSRREFFTAITTVGVINREGIVFINLAACPSKKPRK